MKNKLYLSQSMLKDWTKMCHLAFSKRWFGDEHEKKLFSIDDRQPVRFGILFETLVVGSGVSGKVIEWTDKEKRSVYYDRIHRQAKLCRQYLKDMGGKILQAQDYIQTSFEHEGSTYYIQGNIDVRYGFDDGRQAVIDLKSTGCTDNTFGEHSWGNLEKIDTTQLEHYSLLVQQKFGIDPEAYYLVFDISKEEKFVPIQVSISEQAMYEHKERVAKVYREISEAIMLDYFEPNNSFSNCKSCPLNTTCKFANPYPELSYIDK